MMVKARGTGEQQLVLRGAMFILRRKCGKASCHCAIGDAHESPALAYPAGGRTKTMTLGAQDVAIVRAALARYHSARGELDAVADAGIAALSGQLAARRQQRKR